METGRVAASSPARRSPGPIGWAELGLVPDGVVRAAIRRLNRERLADIRADDVEWTAASLDRFVTRMHRAEVAPLPQLANEQHYEVPAAFFEWVLGRHRKYSCAYWKEGVEDLDEAEAEALRRSCAHAQIRDGQSVLDLGCGWGSLSLWMARRYPRSRITALSNSNSQRLFIEERADELGLNNVHVITCDMNDFDIDRRFDRVVSVEMFEHMRNYPELFRRIHGWLNPGGQFFMHIFCHRAAAYEFVDAGDSDWMSRYFFSGGIMPSAGLPLRFQRHLNLVRQWRWNGRHYERTADAWLQRMDQRKSEVMPVLRAGYGQDAAELWFQRWRMFFMACAELFGHDGGREWFVSHYRFQRAEDG